MAQRRSIRIVTVDDHCVVRAGLRAILRPHADLEVVGEGASAEEVLPLVHSCQPDVVLLDLQLGASGSSIGIISRLRQQERSVRVVVLTNYSDEEHVCGAIAAGAHAYVLKRADSGEIIDAVRSVHSGRRYIAAEASCRLADHTAQPSPLTDREQEVLGLVARGDRNKRIAALLGVGEQTVKT
ncbi:MAG: response regulator transcription factor, partial [Acidobacteriota bacterium]|nr:response regulator transcription factor [Acidobacteriota bacterium]